MRKRLILITTIWLLLGCQPNQKLEVPEPRAARDSVWSVYDLDPEHLWNRLFRQLYGRTTADGAEYGSDELDPLLWFDTTYLLEGPSHEQAIQALDEFLNTEGESLIRDPLRRAMFQRDLWAVFDWLASRADTYPRQREALKLRLAEIMKRVALSRDEILSLPDYYTLAVESSSFRADFQPDHPEAAFLPPDLFQPESAWVPMGREGGPVAMTHTEAFPFFGRSVFLVFVRSPNRRAGTRDYIHSLMSQANTITPAGTEVALVRRMLLIDNRGELILSPLVETVQMRHFSPVQSFYEFELDRKRLFEGSAGGLVPNDDLFMLFMSHGDVFERPELPAREARIPDICKACHERDASSFRSGYTLSIISYSRQPFPLPDNERPILFATTVVNEQQAVIAWKREHITWRSLQGLWKQTSP